MSERPSPHSIAICTVIVLYSDGETEEVDPKRDGINDSDDVCRLLQRLVLSPCDGWLEQSNSPETTSCQTIPLSAVLSEIESCGGGRKKLQALLDSLIESSSSIDALVDLFSSFRSAITNKTVDGNSVHGVFLRKRCLGFDQLSFESVSRLWRALRDYVEEGKSHMEGAPATSVSKWSDMEMEPGSSWPLSSPQMERVLRRRCLALEQNIGILPFSQMEIELQSILQQIPELPAAHFLRFLNCLYHNERVGALDSLHRYFDYAMIRERRVEPQQQTRRRSSVLHYAAILLAASHYHFGEDDLSLKATEEAIRVAQQSGDGACVAYALGWLHYNASLQPHQSEELLRRCATRASHHQLSHLASGAMLSLTHHLITSARDPHLHPSRAWDSLASASVIGSNNGAGAATRIANCAESSDTVNISAKQTLVAAGVWESFGHAPFASLFSATALHCYGAYLSSLEFSIAVHKIAFAALHGFCGDLLPLALRPDGTLPLNRIALHPAKRKGRKAQKSMRSANQHVTNVYSVALQKLIHLRQRYPNPTTNIWMHTTTLLLHQWALNRCEVNFAYSLSYLLQSTHPLPVRSHNLPITIQSLSQYTLLLCQQKSFSKAKELTQELCSLCKSHGLHFHHAKSLLQLALLHLQSKPNRPVHALDAILTCLVVTDAHSIDSLHACALSILAKVHLEWKDYKRARAILKGVISTLIQHAPFEIQGEAWMTLAQCFIQNAGREIYDKKKMEGGYRRILSLAISHLEEAQLAFRKVENLRMLREVYYLQARLFHALNRVEKRDDAARKWRGLGVYEMTACGWSVWQDVLVSVVELREVEWSVW